MAGSDTTSEQLSTPRQFNPFDRNKIPPKEVVDGYIQNGVQCKKFIEFPEDEIVAVPSEDDFKSCLSAIQIGAHPIFGEPHDKKTFSSFGDDGTTASVNTYGDILQISRFLGGEQPNHFSIDPAENEYHWPQKRPFLIGDRADWLWSLAKIPAEGVGLRLKWPSQIPLDRREQDLPSLAYIHCRWPRYTYSTQDFEVVRQFFSHKGSIIQQCQFKRKEKHTYTESTTSDDLRDSKRRESGTEEASPEHDVRCDTQQEHAVPRQLEEVESKQGVLWEAQSLHEEAVGDSAAEPQTAYARRSIIENSPTSDLKDEKDAFQNEDHIKPSEGPPAWPILNLETNFFIRSLDWHDDTDFNKDEVTSQNYSVFLGPEDRSLVVTHQWLLADQRTDQEPREVVGLIIMPFVNEKACKIERMDDPDFEYWNRPQYRIRHEGESNDDELEITVCYRLQRMRYRDNPWQSLLFRFSDIDVPVDYGLSEISSSSPGSSEYLNFIMKRNVDHILSVCSIPISDQPVWDFNEYGDTLSEGTEENEGQLIAPTCGDMSGHFFLAGASNHAFQFLLEIYQRLKSNDVPEESPLRKKIESTCRGHLNWVLRKERFSRENFCADSDITGKKHRSSYEEGFPSENTARIFIQTQAFVDVIGSSNVDSIKERIKGFVNPWIASLQRLDPRDNFVFGLEQWEEDEIYSLTNQALIWAALKAIEGLQLDNTNFRMYDRKKAQKKMRKRFITENPVSNRRMLAVRRSTLESSFWIRDMDTPLFYHSKFFENAPDSDKLIREWESLVDVQRYHRMNQDMDWRSPTFYGVAIMMAKDGSQLNSRSPSDMYDEATKVLLRSCLPNGLFPGLLDERTKAPVFHSSFDVQKDYWWDSFELPYLICRAGVEPKKSQSKKDGQAKTGPSQLDIPESSRDIIMDDYVSFKTLLEYQGLIDSRNISEYPDEWLCECPDFLHFLPSEPKDLKTLKSPGHECLIPKEVLTPVPPSPEVVGLIAYDMGGSIDEKVHFLRNCDIENRMCQCRTAGREALIKKRFIWLPWGNDKTAETFQSAVAESQKAGLSEFFERHRDHKKFFLDDPTAADNTWITEFHLSFYQLKEEKDSQSKETAMAPQRSFPLKGTLLAGKSAEGIHQVICRGTMGFRFYGDFFDRYWHCHFVEQNRKRGPSKLDSRNPGENAPKDLLNRGFEFLEKLSHKSATNKGQKEQKEPWRQRKLLELIIFDEMIKEIIDSTDGILKEIRDALRNVTVAQAPSSNTLENAILSDALMLSQIDSRAYFILGQQWQILEKILELLEDDLTETLLRVSSWESREKDRGSERPRWTKKDERSYRGNLRKILVLNGQNVAQLRRLQANVQSLRTSLSSKRDSIRDDLSLRGSEDVRYFTFVTVVFLPLGFATSIFSMSGSPAGATLGSMAVTALIALCVTVTVICTVSWYNNRERWHTRWEYLKSISKFQHRPLEWVSGAVNGARRSKANSDTDV